MFTTKYRNLIINIRFFKLSKRLDTLMHNPISGAFNITKEAKIRSEEAQAIVDSTKDIIDDSENVRDRVEKMLEENQEEFNNKLTENQESLANLNEEVTELSNKITDINNMVRYVGNGTMKMQLLYLYNYRSRDVRKPVFGISDQVRHKPAYTVSNKGCKLEI